MRDLTKHDERIHADLGWKRLSKTWAKLEILLGLSSAAVGLVLLVMWASSVAASEVVARTPGARPAAQHCCDIPDNLPGTEVAAGFGLFVLGGYLALAGQRSHLYQTQMQLTAFLITTRHQLEDFPLEGSSHVS